MKRALPAALGLAFVAVLGVAVAPGCSLGDGVGSVSGELDLADCWVGHFDLNPNFFAAVPYRDTLTLRIQNGGDYETFSDGVAILVDSISQVRGDSSQGFPGELGQDLQVSLPPEVTPPGVPVKAVPNPAIVHLTLYLQRTCHTQVEALYAVDKVTLNASGGCGDDASGEAGPPMPLALQCGATGGAPASPSDGGADASFDATSSDASPQADAGAPAPAGPVGTSHINFTHLFNGKPDESDAENRLNEGTFEVYLADPRDICPGGLGPPPKCKAHLKGSFKFYFERGRPAQPFP